MWLLARRAQLHTTDAIFDLVSFFVCALLGTTRGLQKSLFTGLAITSCFVYALFIAKLNRARKTRMVRLAVESAIFPASSANVGQLLLRLLGSPQNQDSISDG